MVRFFISTSCTTKAWCKPKSITVWKPTTVTIYLNAQLHEVASLPWKEGSQIHIPVSHIIVSTISLQHLFKSVISNFSIGHDISMELAILLRLVSEQQQIAAVHRYSAPYDKLDIIRRTSSKVNKAYILYNLH